MSRGGLTSLLLHTSVVSNSSENRTSYKSYTCSNRLSNYKTHNVTVYSESNYSVCLWCPSWWNLPIHVVREMTWMSRHHWNDMWKKWSSVHRHDMQICIVGCKHMPFYLTPAKRDWLECTNTNEATASTTTRQEQGRGKWRRGFVMRWGGDRPHWRTEGALPKNETENNGQGAVWEPEQGCQC